MEISQSQLPGKGSLYVVGIGPGSPDMLTRAAEAIITGAEVVIGNDFYIDQINHLLKTQSVIRSRMGKEVERTREAIALAETKHVVMISGGDPGIYGMAGLILEMAEKTAPDLHVEVIPGITAASAGAAKLGAPLSNDFAVISLSDLLTPKEIITARIKALCEVGIPLVLYNPKSRTRSGMFEDAIAIAKEHLSPDTPVGIVRDGFRPDEKIIVTTLRCVMDLEDAIDMHTVVFIGGNETKMVRRANNERGIFTPRGYHRKYVY